VERREGCLQADHAERRLLEGSVLLVPRVRRVIRGHAPNRAVTECLDECEPVVLGPKRRVHLQVRVERAHRLVGQAEVVRGHFRRRDNAAHERRPQRLDRLGGREVHDVHRTLLVPGECEVPRHHHRFGDGRIAGEAQLGGDGTLVRLSGTGQCRLLAVQRDRPLRHGGVLERAAEQPRGDHRPAVVGEPGGSRVGELAQLGELLAELPLGDGSEEADGHRRLRASGLDQRPEHGGRVDDRIGVRHPEDRAVAARGRGLGSRRDRLLVLAARRAEVHVRIDERGSQHRPALAPRLEADDHAILDREAQGFVDALHRIERAAFEDE
jgi:hypothetical protein